MASSNNHIPFLQSITDFFTTYGLGKPLHTDIMCMKLEKQPDDKLLHMPLYRAGFFRIIHFTNASLRYMIPDKEHDIIDNCLCFTFPGKLESWTRVGRLYGHVIYFNPSFAGLDITRSNFNEAYPYFNFDSESMIPLTTEESGKLTRLEDEMILEIGSESIDKLEMILKYLHLYLLQVKRIYLSKVNSFTPEEKSSKSLLRRFYKELDDYLLETPEMEKSEIPTVSLIAKKLFVNANYLNSIVKKVTGKTASAHIQEKLMLEAKSLLIHTDLNIADIAYKLGFSSTPYFNRFFKKNVSLPPLSYRKQFVKS
jgi:AraC family transcriptional regulator, transcriptional activator of pobA